MLSRLKQGILQHPEAGFRLLSVLLFGLVWELMARRLDSLLLPGFGEDGPTLEIFHYDTLAPPGTPAVNRPGFAHIAFEVTDVAEARQQVIAHGGRAIGEVVTLTTKAGKRVTFCYVTDPEGNGIELQHWSSA
jgi:catechol 2,3-dioxygenase-like lactoylglutathione lyase family enzyme